MSHGQNVLINSSFEAVNLIQDPYSIPYDAINNPDGYVESWDVGGGGIARTHFDSTAGMGWKTTATNDLIELWRIGNVVPADGNQFAELNAHENAALYQDVMILEEGLVDTAFHHRGRAGTDTMEVTITFLGANNLWGGGDDSVVFSKQYSTSNLAWSYYTENNIFTSVAGGSYRFSYGAISTATNNIGVGNFLDNPTFGINVVPEPSAAWLAALGSISLLRRRRN